MRALCVVLGAELRQLLRDMNTLMFSVLFPLFMFPGLIWFYSQSMEFVAGWEEALRPRVSAPASLVGELPETVEVVAPGEPADAVIEQDGRDIRVAYRSADPVSALAERRVMDALDDPWEVDTHDVAPAEEALTGVMARVIPALLVILAVMASLYPAVEAVVADRERGTLETTLVTAAPRWVFVAGKLASVGVITLVAMFATGAGALVTLGHLALLSGASIGIPPLRLLIALPVAAVTALAGASLALVAAAPTRSFKQAQNTSTGAASVVMLAAMLGMLPRASLEGGLGWVPVTNAILVMRELLLGHSPGWWTVVATAQLAGITAVATFWTARSLGKLEVR